MAADLAAGEAGPADQTPCVLQACPVAFLDLRFVTSYTNTGAATSCYTFQRRFSRRYLPYREAGTPPAPGALAVGASMPRQATPEVLARAGPANTATAAQRSPAAASAGLEASASAALLEPVCSAAAGGSRAHGAVCEEAAPHEMACGEEAELQLDDGALADSERSQLNRTLGPVDPSLKMLMRKAAHGLVQYVQKAHLLTLKGLVCEFVRDASGHLWFMGPLRTQWASLIPGRGGEPWANANLTQQPREEDSWPSAEQDDGEQQQQQQQHEKQHRGETPASAAGAGLPPPRLLPPSVVRQGDSQHQRPSATPSSASYLAPLPGRTPSCALPPFTAAGGGSPLAKQALTGSRGLQRSSPDHQRLALPCSPSQAGLKGRMLPPCPLGGSARRQAHATAWMSGGGGSRGGHSTPKGSAALATHLTKELEAMREELLLKNDLIDALEGKVEDLMHDKHVVTGAFESVLEGMQGDLKEVKGRLEELRMERDRLASQLTEARVRLASCEEERSQLRAALDSERNTAFTSLGRFQAQQEDAGMRAARAEAELRVVQERLAEEQAACGALKKQMVFYQHTLGDNGGSTGAAVQLSEAGRVLWGQERPEVEYVDTLQAVDELVMRESDPAGERYALSKVLHTCQADLHAIFLHYCLLDPGFARHWPPKLSLPGWLAFMKEIGSTNPVPGTRTRSDNTLHLQEATDVFRRYCLRQAVMRGGPLSNRPGTSQQQQQQEAAYGSAGPVAASEQPQRPSSGQGGGGTASEAATSRPFSASSAAQLAGASMSYTSFCAALVHVAAKMARGSAEALEACPFLSEQTRAFVDSILPKAQQVAPIPQAAYARKGAPGSGNAAMAAKPAPPPGGMGAKEAAAKDAAAKLLPKLKKARGKAEAAAAAGGKPASSQAAAVVAVTAAAAECSTIPEASQEGSAAVRPGSGMGGD